MNKSDREAAMQLRRIQMEKENKEEKERIAKEARDVLMAKWEPGLIGARKHNELNVSWQGFTFLIPEIYDFKNLVALRLVGNTLLTLPEELCANLPQLKVLFLTANHLSSLPESIGLCTKLKELNIMKNDIKVLPDSICNLLDLESFEASNNKLTFLPQNFGNLKKLPRLVIERNFLEQLPESFGELKLQVLNLSCNKFKEMHPSIFKISSLKNLFMNDNVIELIPREVENLSNLTSLQLCNNKISILPEPLCSLKSLERLWLDWNKIEVLPLRFIDLKNLKEFKLEQNPVYKPSSDIVYQGALAIMKWCNDKIEAIRKSKRRVICVSVQKVLAYVYLHNLSDDGHFRAEVPWEGNDGVTDDFYAMINFDYFMVTLLPKVLEMWKSDTIMNIPFDHSREEILDAIYGYKDSYGSICIETKVKFLRCTCVNEKGKKKVCVPPDANFMCEREAIIIKMSLMNMEVRRQKETAHQMEVALKEAIEEVNKKTSSWLDSTDGKAQIDAQAHEAAQEDFENKLKDKFYKSHEGNLERQFNKKMDKIKKRRLNLSDSKAKRVKNLNVKKDKLQLKLKRLKGWQYDAGVEELEDLEDQINHSIEDDNLILCDEEQKEIEEWYKEEKAKLMTGYKPRSDMMKELDSASSAFQEAKRERYYQFRDEYIEQEVSSAEEKVKHEFAVYKRIVNRWLGMSLNLTFYAWKGYVKEIIDEREYLQLELEDKRKLAVEGIEAARLLKEAELAKWQEKWDEYNDRVYFQHSETGEIVYDAKPERNYIERTSKMQKK